LQHSDGLTTVKSLHHLDKSHVTGAYPFFITERLITMIATTQQINLSNPFNFAANEYCRFPLSDVCQPGEDPWQAVAAYLEALGTPNPFQIQGETVRVFHWPQDSEDEYGIDPSSFNEDMGREG